MIKLGLTGGFGSGKSSVTRYFEAQGYPVIDADEIARGLLDQEKQSPTLKSVISSFGESILDDSGKLVRSKLADSVFSDPEKLKQLNTIMQPAIRQLILEDLKHYQLQQAEVVIVDAPLLFETGLANHMDHTVVVWTPEDICIQRLVEQRNIRIEDARRRISMQLPLESKKAQADYVIDNAGTRESAQQQASTILAELLQEPHPAP